MTKRKNSLRKELQEVATANELIKTNLSDITEQGFRIVIKLIAGIQKGTEDSRESIAAEIKELKNSHDELKNVVNEVQNKLEAVTVRIEEQRGEQVK